MVAPVGSPAISHAFKGTASGIAPKPDTVAPATTEAKIPGVVRNLMSGHYKGVADVRLRIVHADRIAALQLKADQSHLAAMATALNADLTGTVESFVSDHTGGDPAVDAALAAAAADFSTAVADGAATLDEALTALEEALRAALPQPGVDQTVILAEPLTGPADEITVDQLVDSSAEQLATDPVDELMTVLREMVRASQQNTSTASILPPLSGYSGNGKVYARFLETYRSMSEPAAATVEESERLELAA